MSASTRQKVILGALVALFVVILLTGGRGGDGVGDGESLQSRIGRERAEAARSPLVTEVVTLDMHLLDPESGAFSVGRDPFRFGQVEAPPPRPRPAPPPPREPEPTPAPEPAPPAGPTPPSMTHLSYMGSFGSRQRPIAVVTSGEEIFNVREGETLEGKFVIEEIGFESVAVGYVDFPDEPPLRLPVGG